MNYLLEEISDSCMNKFNDLIDSVDKNGEDLKPLEDYLFGELKKIELLLEKYPENEILEVNRATVLLMLSSIKILKMC